MDEKWLKNIVKTHQEDCLISQFSEMKSTLASPQGENYCSKIDRVKVKAVLNSGQKVTLSFIVKTYPESTGVQKLMEETGAFKVETETYLNVLKQMENLMAEQDIIQDKIWPEFVGYRPYDILVFQDLAIENYKVIPRRACQDIDHARLVMAELARYHAMGKVLLARGKIKEEDYKYYFMARGSDVYKKTVHASTVKMAEVMKSSWGPEWSDISERLVKYGEKLMKTIPSLAGTAHKKFKVLNHGDPWTCNMMFKHRDYDNKPIAMRLIDFQMTHVDSFGWDLIYYMYGSIQADCRRQNHNHLLKLYSDVYRKTLLSMNIPLYDIPTFEEVVEEMDRLKPLRVMVLCFFHVVMTASMKDSFDLAACMNADDKDVAVTPKAECYTDELFKKSVGPELKELVKIGLL